MSTKASVKLPFGDDRVAIPVYAIGYRIDRDGKCAPGDPIGYRIGPDGRPVHADVGFVVVPK